MNNIKAYIIAGIIALTILSLSNFLISWKTSMRVDEIEKNLTLITEDLHALIEEKKTEDIEFLETQAGKIETAPQDVRPSHLRKARKICLVQKHDQYCPVIEGF